MSQVGSTIGYASPPLRAICRAARPQQWVKNLLIFVPLVLGQNLTDGPMLLATFAGFAVFCLVASAGYIVNDLLDIRADRQHPRKCHRPFASGALSRSTGIIMIAVAVCCAMLITIALQSWLFAGWTALYFVLTVAYSVFLKKLLIIDVLVLAGLYTLRIMAGGAAADVMVSPWLLAFSGFLFFNLAMLKRYAELKMIDQMQVEAPAGRGYRASDLSIVRSAGPSSGYMAVLVLAIYLSNSETVEKLYDYPQALWMICPLLLYWITRAWFLAERGEINDDAISFALRDRITWLTVGLVAVLGCIASL